MSSVTKTFSSFFFFSFFFLSMMMMLTSSSSSSSLSPFVSAVTVLSGNLDFTHDWISSSVIEFNMSAPIVAGKYFAVAVQPSSSSTAMTSGLGVGCEQPASGTTTTTCQAITTSNYGVSTRTDASLTLVSASTDGTKAYVQVRLDPSLMSLTTSSRRVIFSVGTWSGGVTQHSTTADRGGTIVSFTAPPTTTTTTTTTTSAPVTTGALSTGTYLSGNLGVGYTWNGTRITWTLDTPILSNHYGAVAVSPSAMTSGLGVSCLMPTGSSAAACSAISTSSYNVAARVDNSLTIDASWTTASRAYVSVTVDAAAMGVTSGSKRCILSIGNWNSGLPAQHANTASRAATTINFVQQTTTTTPTTVPPTTSSTTTTITSTTTTLAPTTPTPTPTTTTPATTSYLAGKIGVGVSWVGNRVSWTFDTPLLTNRYAALSVSPSNMVGVGLACLMPTASTSASCSAISTSNYNVAARTDATLSIDSSSVTATRAYVTVSVDAVAMGISTAGSKRCIMSVGNWNSGLPSQHQTFSDRGAANINFVQQTTTTAAPTTATSTTTVTPAPGVSTTPVPPTTSSTTTVTSTTTQTSTTTSTTATPAPPSGPTTTFPPTTTPSFSSAYLSGKLGVGYSWSSVDDKITFTLDTPLSTNGYGAIALSANTMAGLGVACKMGTTASPSSASCVAITTSNYNVAARTDATLTVESSSVTATRSYVTVSVSASAMGISTAGSKRCIMSVGSWNSAGNLPGQHATTSDRGAATISFSSLGTTSSTTLAAGQTNAPTTSSTTMPPTTTTAVPTAATTGNEISMLNGDLTMKWNPVTLSDANLTITLTSKSSATFSAVGWSSQGMAGKAIACVFPSAAVGAKCLSGDTTNYGWSNQAAQLNSILSAEITDSATGAWKIEVTFPKSSMAIKSDSEQSLQRMIFATGTYSPSSYAPTGHTTSSRSAASVNIYTGKTANIEEKPRWRYSVALICSFIYVIIIALIGNALSDRHVPAAKFLHLPIILSFIGLFFGVLFAAKADLEVNNIALPLERAWGAATGYLFMLILLPVNKHFNIAHVAGSSYERLVGSYHAVCGICIFIMMIVHMILMLEAKAFTFETIGDSSLYHHPPLPAFIALILLSLMMLTGFLRRKFYALFRLVHILFFPVMILVVVHAPSMAIPMSPGLLLYIADKIAFIVHAQKTKPEVKLCEYDPLAKVTHLKIQVQTDIDVPAAGFAFLAVDGAFVIPHPFTIAAYDEKMKMLTFLIREIGPATAALGAAAKAGKVKSVSKVTRPLGHLTLPLTGKHATSKIVFLCSAGIGITPAINIANYLARNISSGRLSPTENPISQLNLIWSIREETLVETVKDILQSSVFDLLKNDNNINGNKEPLLFGASAMKVNVFIYVTSGGSGNKKHSAVKTEADQELDDILMGPKNDNNNNTGDNTMTSSSAGSMKTILGERPKFDSLFTSAKKGLSTSNNETVSVYSCGPVPFMQSVKNSAENCGCLLHEETFEM